MKEDTVGEDRALNRKLPSYRTANDLRREELFDDGFGRFCEVEPIFCKKGQKTEKKICFRAIVENFCALLPDLMPTIGSPLSYLLPQTLQIVPALGVAGREVVSAIAVQNLIIFLLRMRVGVELDCGVLSLEGGVGSDDNKIKCYFYLVDQSCVLDEKLGILQKLLIGVAATALASLHYPCQ